MRTTNHQSPLALWQTSMITAPDDSSVTNWATYGTDVSGSDSVLIETRNNVVVPNSDVNLSEDQISYLQQEVNPMLDDGNNGIEHFLTI